MIARATVVACGVWMLWTGYCLGDFTRTALGDVMVMQGRNAQYYVLLGISAMMVTTGLICVLRAGDVPRPLHTVAWMICGYWAYCVAYTGLRDRPQRAYAVSQYAWDRLFRTFF